MSVLGRFRRSEGGGAIVELALALPLLVAVMAGTVDFARVYYASIALTNAARAGAQFGSYSLSRSGNFAGMQTAATSSIVPNTGVTASASRTCNCATNAGVFGSAVACTTTCPTGQHLVVTVTVTATRTFTTVMSGIPGIPNSVNLSRSATLRVVN
jgi:Flp pilus assembly protein TadG